MRHGRVALLTAIAAVLALGVALALWPAPQPLPDMHERYRVELDLPPVDAALWFAARYPKYFTSGETELDPWLDSLDPRDRDFVLAMGQTLTWAWVEHELAHLPAGDPLPLALAATVVVRRRVVESPALHPRSHATRRGAVALQPRFITAQGRPWCRRSGPV